MRALRLAFVPAVLATFLLAPAHAEEPQCVSWDFLCVQPGGGAVCYATSTYCTGLVGEGACVHGLCPEAREDDACLARDYDEPDVCAMAFVRYVADQLDP